MLWGFVGTVDDFAGRRRGRCVGKDVDVDADVDVVGLVFVAASGRCLAGA